MLGKRSTQFGMANPGRSLRLFGRIFARDPLPTSPEISFA
jgi:hypothetical protein